MSGRGKEAVAAGTASRCLSSYPFPPEDLKDFLLGQLSVSTAATKSYTSDLPPCLLVSLKIASVAPNLGLSSQAQSLQKHVARCSKV